MIRFFMYDCRKLLSMQQHYDWGLRALKTVVGGCGSALRAARANSITVGLYFLDCVYKVCQKISKLIK